MVLERQEDTLKRAAQGAGMEFDIDDECITSGRTHLTLLSLFGFYRGVLSSQPCLRFLILYER